MWHPIKHYKTIHHHKMLVMQGCFRCGLYWQGLTHDLSKLSPVEFWAGAKYWQGTCSRSEEHTSELQSLKRISYAVSFCR